MSAAFTPGPWEVRGASVFAADGNYLAEGGHAPTMVSISANRGVEQRERDLALIAAAPELYDALEAIIIGISQRFADGKAIKAGVEALAKARGGQ